MKVQSLLLIALSLACAKHEVADDGTTMSRSAAPSLATAPAAAAPTSSQPTAAAACSMLTTGDLKEVTGLDFVQNVSTPGALSQCGWTETNGTVTLQLYERNIIEEFKKSQPDMQPLAGLGDAALLNAKGGQVVVAKGNRSLMVAVAVSGAKPEWAQELARVAAKKL